jgi:hypothetical protein
MKPTNQTTHYRSLEDIVANINNECRWCSGKDCSVCVCGSINKSKELLGEETSFLFKKTIYKVKKEG